MQTQTTALAVRNTSVISAMAAPRSIEEVKSIAEIFALSGMFPLDNGKQSMAQLAVKIMAGAEIGLPPFAAANGMQIIKGRCSSGANIMAAKVKASGRYDYRIRVMTDEEVSIAFFENGKEVGVSTFTAKDAARAGTQNMGKFPRNMLFARAISNGVRWFCPDIFSGVSVYTPDEMGVAGEYGEDGDFVTVEATSTGKKTPVSQPQASPPADTVPEFTLADVEELNPETPNPLDDPTAGTFAERLIDYAAVATRIADGRGNEGIKKLIKWMRELHTSNGTGPASKAQYGLLVSTVEGHSGKGTHNYVLSVLCGRYVDHASPPSAKMASALLNVTLADVKDKETGDAVPNVAYRSDVCHMLLEIARTLTELRMATPTGDGK